MVQFSLHESGSADHPLPCSCDGAADRLKGREEPDDDDCSDQRRLERKLMSAVQSHWWPFQYRSQRSALPDLTIAQERSPPMGETHQAAVLLPPPEPTLRQVMVGPLTRT